MRVYLGFDDTDHIDADRGTGKLARWFKDELPAGSRIWGVVRQQLLVHDAIPYTSHNSAACLIAELMDRNNELNNSCFCRDGYPEPAATR